MELTKINVKDLDLGQICDSGQCFRMYRVEDKHTDKHTDNTHITGCDEEFEIVAGDKYVRVGQTSQLGDSQISQLGTVQTSQSGTEQTSTPGSRHSDSTENHPPADSREIVFACSEDEVQNFWAHYFDLETDYSLIKRMADPTDQFLSNAIKMGAGIRILNQDLWEMIVTFLISQQNNIPRIHKCIDNICRKYGNPIRVCDDGNSLNPIAYSFPTPDSLAFLPEDELMKCNLGYRSKYVVRTAREIVEGKFDLGEISRMNYLDARQELLKMFGVGVKVADCICLFALHHLEALPVDTHIKQMLEREYGVNPAEMSLEKQFGGKKNPLNQYAEVLGVMQQYIFYAELQQSRV